MANLQILGASWGLISVTSQVIGLVNRQTSPQSLSVLASVSVFPDGWYGFAKSLFVAYRYGDTGAIGVATAKEGGTLNINGPPSADQVQAVTGQSNLTVLAAAFGPGDVTAKVQSMINTNTQSLSFTPNVPTFGDTWPGAVHRNFTIVAAYDGQVPFMDIMTENSPYSLKYRPPLSILCAVWGLQDVRAKIQSLVFRRTLSIVANDSTLGDGWVGVTKSLVVLYQYGNQSPQFRIVTENNTLSFDYTPLSNYTPSLDAGALNIVAAAYGQSDVTRTVAKLVSNNALNFTPTATLFGDNWPGVHKSFVLAYSYGPTLTKTIIVTENTPVSVNPPTPAISTALVTQGGLFAQGDNIGIQSGLGLYLAASSPTGQIIANATSPAAGTFSSFTVQSVPNQPDQFTLQVQGLSAFVAMGGDGTLYSSTVATPLTFTASLTLTGTSVLSVIGSGRAFATLRSDGAIVAGGSDEPTFDATFAIMLNATAEGFQNHLIRWGIDQDDGFPVSLEIVKLAWDLTGGMFLAIGLGPLINGSTTVQGGIYALIRSNPTTSAAFNAVIATVKANLDVTIAAGALLSFAVTVWDNGLWWPILRLAINFGKWYAIGWVATKILQITLLPELEAAELVVSFAKWAYDTTMDALAVINSANSSASIGEPEPVAVPFVSHNVPLLDNKPSLQDSRLLLNGLNGAVSSGFSRTASANGINDHDEEEDDLEDQLREIAIRRKLRELRKRRMVATIH